MCGVYPGRRDPLHRSSLSFVGLPTISARGGSGLTVRHFTFTHRNLIMRRNSNATRYKGRHDERQGIPPLQSRTVCSRLSAIQAPRALAGQCLLLLRQPGQPAGPYPTAGMGRGTGTILACAECNMLLGAERLFTVAERTSWLIKKYEHRYQELLGSPRWTRGQIDELSGRTKKAIERWAQVRLNLGRRLVILAENEAMRSVRD